MRCFERFQNMEEILIWNKTGEEIEIDKENYRKDKNRSEERRVGKECSDEC